MQMLWIGCVESDEEFQNKARKGCTLASAQVSQKNLIGGMEQVSGCVFDSINGSVLPPYPDYQDRDVAQVVWSHGPGAYDVSVGYRNDKYINRVNCKNAMIAAARQWIKNRYQGGELIIMVYSMRSAPMATACYIKKRIPNARIYLIITDLPQFMDLGQSKVKALLKKIDWISIKRMQKRFDGFILYAAKMAEFLKIPADKWLLMEGSIWSSEVSAEEQAAAVCPDSVPVMYSGQLDMEYGIGMLLDAFMDIADEQLELWITGGGNAENYIKQCAKKDKRIRFYGFLPSRGDLLALQRQAAAFINMRLPSQPASAYCFPSKLFEYMMSGKPVISFRIEGIPKSYFDYLIDIKSETKEDVKAAIRAVTQMTENERRMIGERGRRFILENKNHLSQAEKICSFISGNA